MPVQSPFRSDAFEIENADAPVGPRLLEAYLLDGSLRFTDPRVPAGVNLAELAGLQRAHNTIVVSQSGIAASKDTNGNPITTVQGGIDAVPSSADVNDPWLVLLAPGVYIEDVLFLRDGVLVKGVGNVTLREAGAFSTLRFRAGPGSTPHRIRIEGVRIENSQPGEACIDIGSSTFATGAMTISVVPNIGDVASVNGVNLTAIANGVVPAPGEFELGTTQAETAQFLADAINDPVNGLTGVVVVTVAGTSVEVRALQPGLAGNAITLATSVPLVIVLSGPTLAGGTDASPGSTVGDDLIEIIDCDLVASGLNGFQVRAEAVNNISVRGGDWHESSTATFVDVRDCAYFSLVEQPYCQRLELHYDNTNPNLPSIATSVYRVQSVDTMGLPLNSALVGIGTLTLTDCTIGNVSFAGDGPARTWGSTRCRYGAVTVGGAGTVTMSNCTRGSLVGAGTGTFAESTVQGSAVFAGVAAVTVTFGEPQPDTNYRVFVEPIVVVAALSDVPYVAAKTVAGFDIVFGAVQATTVEWLVTRDL